MSLRNPFRFSWTTRSLVALAMLGVMFPQEQPLHTLSTTHDTLVQGVTADTVALPLKCDPDGIIFTRLVENEGMQNFVRISADGRDAKEFYTNNLEGISKPRLIDFSSAGSEVFALVQDTLQYSYWIVRYAADGRTLDKTKVEEGFRPSQIAVFSSGEILLAGKEKAKSDTSPATVPFVGLFQSDGHFVKRITLKRDIEQNQDVVKLKLPDPDYDVIISGSALIVGDDGFAYLMRRATNGPIFKISRSGELVKILAIEPPLTSVNSGLLAISHSLLVTEFLQTKANSTEIRNVVLEILDARTGQGLFAASHSDADIGPSLACYDRGDFVFLSPANDLHYHLIRVSASK